MATALGWNQSLIAAMYFHIMLIIIIIIRRSKEKKMLENLKRRANSDLSLLRELLAAKEKGLDELRSKKVKLEKMVARDKRIKNNNTFI